MKLKTFGKAALGTLLLSSSFAASAFEDGDWLVRFGGSNVDPKSNNGDVVDVGSDTSITFTGSYMLTDAWSLELLAAWPFEHTINLKSDGSRVGSTKHLPPTFSINYHLFRNADFRPYVGVGVNYTNFFDTDTKGDLDNLGGDLDLDSSWGLAGEIGIDYELTNDWMIGAQVYYMDIDTDAKLKISDLGYKEKFNVSIDPWVYLITVGKKF